MQIKDLDSKQLHHAYVLVSSTLEAAKNELERFITKDLGIEFHGNPDVFVGEYGSVGIDDLSDIVSMHQRVAIGPKKIIILLTTGLSLQAQNSILKMIEEPTINTHFFISIPSASLLLPTVLSRVHLIELDSEQSINPKVAKFISSSVPERLEIVKEMLSELDKEKISKEDVVQYISSVMEEVNKKDKSPETLSVLSRVTDYLRDPSSSLKMLFEYLSLRLKS